MTGTKQHVCRPVLRYNAPYLLCYHTFTVLCLLHVTTPTIRTEKQVLLYFTALRSLPQWRDSVTPLPQSVRHASLVARFTVSCVLRYAFCRILHFLLCQFSVDALYAFLWAALYPVRSVSHLLLCRTSYYASHFLLRQFSIKNRIMFSMRSLPCAPRPCITPFNTLRLTRFVSHVYNILTALLPCHTLV